MVMVEVEVETHRWEEEEAEDGLGFVLNGGKSFAPIYKLRSMKTLTEIVLEVMIYHNTILKVSLDVHLLSLEHL
jgi:hypothetical protein